MSSRITVDETTKGKRFDVIATEMLPMLSRAYVHVLIEGRRVLLNGRQEKPGYKVRMGDSISTDFDPKELEQIADIDLPIIFEDDNVLVVNKPVGVISHSRGKYWNEPSVASFVRQKTQPSKEHTDQQNGPAVANDGPASRAGIVHRLDRATSGVMICAKNPETLSFLQKQFSQRKVKKTYMAVVAGHIEPREATIDMPIERNPKAPATFRVGANGKPATTTYFVEAAGKTNDLLRLEPTTGRTHQLRVHLAHLGHPILGDVLYKGKEADRLFLHALSLEITLPDSKRVTFTAPLPKEFKAHST